MAGETTWLLIAAKAQNCHPTAERLHSDALFLADVFGVHPSSYNNSKLGRCDLENI
jgi:hypothetical protein